MTYFSASASTERTTGNVCGATKSLWTRGKILLFSTSSPMENFPALLGMNLSALTLKIFGQSEKLHYQALFLPFQLHFLEITEL